MPDTDETLPDVPGDSQLDVPQHQFSKTLGPPLAINTDALPERRYAAATVQDVLPAAAYERLGQFALTEEQEAILNEPTPANEVDIKPDGTVYVSHEYYVRLLNRAFGRMGWTMVPGSPLTARPGTEEYYQRWVLFVGGVYASEALASRVFYPDNRNMDLSDVAESIKSDCKRRVCKDLGIATEPWQRRWAANWKRENAVEVLVQTQRGNVKQWRRIDGEPLKGEIRPASARGGGSEPAGSAPSRPAEPPPAPVPPKAAEPPPAPKPAEVGGPPPRPPVQMKMDKPAAPKGPSLLPAQQRLVWARARSAQLVVGNNCERLHTALLAFGIADAAQPGKTWEEVCGHMIAQIPGPKLKGFLAAMVVPQAEDEERI